MAVRKIETEISLTGEKEFNDQMKKVNSNLKTLKSDMALVSSEFQGNSNSVEALRQKQSALSELYQQQQEKVRALTEHLNKIKDAYGEESVQADKYKQQLNAATIQMNNFGRELENTNRYLEEAEKSTDGTAKSIDEFGKAVKDSGEKSKAFGDVARIAFGELTADLVRSGVEDLKDKVVALSDAIKSAPIDLVKGMASAFSEVSKAVVDQTLASAEYADEILTLATNTGLTTQQLQEYRYMEELVDVSTETITGSMKKLTNNMDNARAGTGAAKDAFDRLGISVANADGTLRDNNDVFLETIDSLSQIENATERDALSMDIFGKSAQELNGLIAIGKDGIAAFAEEANAAGAVLNDNTLSALGAVDDALQRFRNTLEATKNAVGAEFAQPVEIILNGLTAVMQGDIEGGLDLIEAGLDQAIAIIDQLLPESEQLVLGIITTLMEHLPDVLETGAELISSLILGIATTMPEIIPQMVTAISTMVSTLTSSDSLRKIIQAGVDLIVQLAIAMAQMLPELVPVMLDAIGTIVTTLWDNRGDILEAGANIVRGIWEGILSMGSWLAEKISGWASSILDNIKGAFGIASPSRVMRDQVGVWLARGVGEGFADAMDEVNRMMQESVDTSFDLTPNVKLRGAIYSGGENSYAGKDDGSVSWAPASGSTGPVTIDITLELDGAVLARKQFTYNKAEAARNGPSLVEMEA